jgi:hypothetical protein
LAQRKSVQMGCNGAKSTSDDHHATDPEKRAQPLGLPLVHDAVGRRCVLE